MSDLKKIKDWVASYPGYDILGTFKVDYTSNIPSNGGIFPAGLLEISRARDIMGNVTIHNQYNFGLYYVFLKDPGDDAGATINADWIMDFQLWIQEQSIRGLAPVFGDDASAEVIRAQNGVLYDADEEGTATYMVQLSVNFIKKIRSESKWNI